MLAQHTETMESWEAERANAKKDLEELTAAHTKAIEDVVAEYRNNTSSYEEKISLQEAVNAKLQLTLEQTQDSLDTLQAESSDLSRQLAQEKMERMTLLAEFDAVKTVRSDTTAIDSLKSNLIATTKAYEETLSSVRMSLQAKQEELDISKSSYRHLEERYTLLNQDLEFVKKSLDAFKADAHVKQGIAEADYNDLNESMTLLVEEANSKVKGLESRVEDLAMKVEIGQKAEEELLRRNEELRKREEEMLIQLKVRNAELAEEKAKAAAELKGLANSRFAGCSDFGDHAAAIGLVAEA
ncbi:hypothetical protein ESCO_003732 [Escovopsis weberi]|uniref:Uncharacterized protein n=1 Tax=Escovopsis weberi TaxID=150374 RepID=A0A0M8N1E2_ESCWE|nr:hypothetical protein ESCO_003732 [Escovopsis weberi]